MPSSMFEDIAVTASITVVPSKIRNLDEDIDLFDGNKRQLDRLKKTIGFDQRRIADASITALDLCYQAASHLLEQSDIKAKNIDGILFVTQTADHSQPSNASLMHRKLECHSECAAFDIGLGCSGFVYGLWLAHSLIHSGSCETILLLSGDTLSRMVHPKDKTTAPLFGDAGSATIIQKKASSGPSWFRLGSDGTGSDALIVPAGGARYPSSDVTKKETEDEEGAIRTLEDLHMDGSSVFNFSIDVVPREIEALLNFAQVEKNTIDFYVLHQANRYIVQNIGKRLQLDLAKLPVRSFEAFGNVSSASIPAAMSYDLSKILVDSERRQILLSGFGVGLSWGSCILPIESMVCLKWFEYDEAMA